MIELDVDGIRFSFADGWTAMKWDDADEHKLYMGRLQTQGHGSKAVDVIGLYGGMPYLFEVKDFRGPAIAIANVHRDLPNEIGFKARDTAAGVVGAVSRGGAGLVAEWLAAVACERNPVRVVAWIAEDAHRPGEREHKRKARFSERKTSIAQKLAWLTDRRRILVEDPLREMSVPGVSAQSLLGAGPIRPRS